MTCPHHLEFDCIYRANWVGTCETCGCEHVCDNMWVLYQGDTGNIHQFIILTPFSCIGCHKVVDQHRNFCGGIEVTEEMQSLKKDTK